MAGAAADPVAVRLAHAMAGRVRLRLAASGAPSPQEMAAIADRIAACPGVARVRARPGTGSVIVEGPGGPDAILGRLTAAGAVRLLPPLRPVPVGMVTGAGLATLDARISRGTGGALDLRTALGLLLAAGAVVQLARGQVAGPATTLGLSAFSLLEPGRR